jgi:hypothetical protein
MPMSEKNTVITANTTATIATARLRPATNKAIPRPSRIAAKKSQKLPGASITLRSLVRKVSLPFSVSPWYLNHGRNTASA